MNYSNILRIATAGSVDNGKSTLIGRLLYDTKSIFEDQLSSIERHSLKRGMGTMDLALFTDGLREEVELGITIDVAYRYFSTLNRKFIIADAPGHVEFTRNMITGASSTDVIIILIDALQGITEQTKRHAFIASMLQISNVVVCVNKMDALNWSEPAFESIVKDFIDFSVVLNLKNVEFIPISALKGDNVVKFSKAMDWYVGNTLLEMLERLSMDEISDFKRVLVQCKIGESLQFSDYGVKVLSDSISMDEQFTVNGSKRKLTFDTMYHGYNKVTRLGRDLSGTIRVENKIHLKRGDILSDNVDLPNVANEFDALICWLDNLPYSNDTELLIQHISLEGKMEIRKIQHKVDVHSFKKIENVAHLEMNDIARVTVQCELSLVYDCYSKNKLMGAFIGIDAVTGSTVFAGTIL